MTHRQAPPCGRCGHRPVWGRSDETIKVAEADGAVCLNRQTLDLILGQRNSLLLTNYQFRVNADNCATSATTHFNLSTDSLGELEPELAPPARSICVNPRGVRFNPYVPSVNNSPRSSAVGLQQPACGAGIFPNASSIAEPSALAPPRRVPDCQTVCCHARVARHYGLSRGARRANSRRAAGRDPRRQPVSRANLSIRRSMRYTASGSNSCAASENGSRWASKVACGLCCT